MSTILANGEESESFRREIVELVDPSIHDGQKGRACGLNKHVSPIELGDLYAPFLKLS